jgi:hypothetical protein
MAARISKFSGVAPALTKWKLPLGFAQIASNTNLDSRTIKPWRDVLVVLAGVTAASITTIYRFGRTLISDTIYWFTWNKDVDVVKGAVIGDTTERTFYTGDGVPKWTNATLATTGGSPPYPIDYRTLGVPRPTVAPTVTISGTAASSDYTMVAFAYTHVTVYGEESAPSPISTPVKLFQGQQASLSGLDPALTGKQSTAARRLYRAITNSNDSGLYFIKEVSIVGGPFVDDVGSNIGEVIQTTSWTPPPSDGFGITMMANGIALMFSGSDIWVSAQYAFYAWPLQYKLATDFPIIGGRAIGNQAVVLTTGNPYLVSGTDSASLVATKIETPEACVSKRSIVNVTAVMPSMMGPNVTIGVVMFASQNGLCGIDSGGTCQVLTHGLLNREDWQALVPSSIQGYVYNGKYFGFYNTGSVTGGFCFDPRDADAALSFFPFAATAGFFDLVQDHMHLQVGTNIVLWNSSATPLIAQWRSGVLLSEGATNWKLAVVRAASYTGSITFKFYIEGVLALTQVVTGPSSFSLPSDSRYHQCEVEIITDTEVFDVVLGMNGDDIKRALAG